MKKAIGLVYMATTITPLSSMKASTLQNSLEYTQAAIAQACGLDLAQVQKEMVDVRPPNGVFTAHTLNLLRQWNYRPVMWSLITEDWTQPGRSVVVQRALQQVQNGSLIVLHDGYYGGGQDVAAIVSLPGQTHRFR